MFIGGGGTGGALTTTVKFPFLVVSALLVAVTVTPVVVVTVGAVKSPVLLIVPTESVQITVCATDEGETLAAHWLAAPEEIGLWHVTVTPLTPGGTGGGFTGGVTLITTVPVTESCMLVAVTVIEVSEVTGGAVSMPVLAIVPLDADQVTAVLNAPLPMTATVQGSDAPDARGLAHAGTTEVTVETTGGACWIGVGWSVCPPPPQPTANKASSARNFVRMLLTPLIVLGGVPS
jgi:hypothetical protein